MATNYQLDRLAEILAEQGPAKALAFAAKLHNAILGTHRDVIQRGHAASRSPETYRAMGVDPAEAQSLALAAIDALLAGNVG